MPFYEYVCTECGELTEVLQRLSDPPETECPSCHAQALTKQVSAAAFRLKGGGWYETDFKSGDKRNLVGDGAAESGAKAESAESKPEAKPDGKAESKSGAAESGTKPDAKAEAKPAAKTASKPAGESSSAKPKPAAPPKSTDSSKAPA